MKIRHTLGKHKNILLGIGLLITGIILGIGITTYFPLLAKTINAKLKPAKVVDETQIKKQVLAKFYNEIITAQDKQDWATLYTLLRQSLRDNVTKEQFVVYETAQAEKDTNVSQNTIIHSIVVNGNKGIVDRTIITCLTKAYSLSQKKIIDISEKDCTGDNRKEDHAKKEYEYIGGKWQIPDPQPSERSLKAANFAYEDSSETAQNNILNNFGYGSQSSTFAVRNWAVYLDGNLEELIRLETLIEGTKTARNRPIVNYQPPAVIQQPNINIEQPSYPKNCTSNTIGDYTYTNCY